MEMLLGFGVLREEFYQGLVWLWTFLDSMREGEKEAGSTVEENRRLG